MKRPSEKKVSKVLQRAAQDYERLCYLAHQAMLESAARELGLEVEEVEEEFACLT